MESCQKPPYSPYLVAAHDQENAALKRDSDVYVNQSCHVRHGQSLADLTRDSSACDGVCHEKSTQTVLISGYVVQAGHV
jgi:hypothetical protein